MRTALLDVEVARSTTDDASGGGAEYHVKTILVVDADTRAVKLYAPFEPLHPERPPVKQVFSEEMRTTVIAHAAKILKKRYQCVVILASDDRDAFVRQVMGLDGMLVSMRAAPEKESVVCPEHPSSLRWCSIGRIGKLQKWLRRNRIPEECDGEEPDFSPFAPTRNEKTGKYQLPSILRPSSTEIPGPADDVGHVQQPKNSPDSPADAGKIQQPVASPASPASSDGNESTDDRARQQQPKNSPESPASPTSPDFNESTDDRARQQQQKQHQTIGSQTLAPPPSSDSTGGRRIIEPVPTATVTVITLTPGQSVIGLLLERSDREAVELPCVPITDPRLVRGSKRKLEEDSTSDHKQKK